MSLLKAMQTHKGERNLTLYWDIETLAYNKIEGRKKPTKYRNVTYSVAIGWNDNGNINVEVFPSFKAFFDAFFTYAQRKDTITKSRTVITMIAHNCNKYDNHFLLHDLDYLYDMEIDNLYMTNAITNENTTNKKTAKMDSKEKNIVLEKRVKSSINLDLDFYLNGFHFTVIDNFMKTTTSIATLGKKLKDGGYLTEDQLKTDFQYDIFDIEDNMTDVEAYAYAEECFNKLTPEQLTYIHNDVIILGQCHIHYSDIFPNFDYNAMTFSVNIMNSYLNNPLTEFQLLNKYGQEKISYTDYKFFDMNYYDFIKGFYRGGLNMYNPRFLDTIIDEPCFSIDINSSYPYVMHSEKIPTYLSSYKEFTTETRVPTNLDNKDKFSLYKVDKQSFNIDILMNLKSATLRKMIVKYYSNDPDYVNINTNTLRMIQDIEGIDLSSIACMCYVTYDCEYFGARDIIHENYYIKSQGKQKHIIKMPTPYEIEITDDINEHPYSQEEINLSKVVLNGLYGIPALRSHFNLFRRDLDGQLENMPNGYKNTERNLLFSTFVTSQSLYNLLVPFQSLTPEEIDDNFIYCDTDSLYMKSVIKHKIDPSLFDPIALGKWDVENEEICKMYVLNHKKYAYLKPNGKIHVASAGIPLSAFDLTQDFETFIRNDFHDGAVVYNNKSIYNEHGTISIYPSKTNIDKGSDYFDLFDIEIDVARQEIIKHIRDNYDFSQYDDMLYIESPYGTLSFSDVFPVKYEYENKCTLGMLKLLHNDIK